MASISSMQNSVPVSQIMLLHPILSLPMLYGDYDYLRTLNRSMFFCYVQWNLTKNTETCFALLPSLYKLCFSFSRMLIFILSQQSSAPSKQK